MNRKWSSTNVKELQRWLKKRWPASFTPGPDLRPLSLQIHKEILAYRDENPGLSSRVLREVLKRHTTSYGYLYGMAKHSKRYNLDGESVGEVSREHRDWARSALKFKQKEAQSIRKAARNAEREKHRALRTSIERKPAVGAVQAGTAGPVIKYKSARRKFEKPGDSQTVKLAG